MVLGQFSDYKIITKVVISTNKISKEMGKIFQIILVIVFKWPKTRDDKTPDIYD